MKKANDPIGVPPGLRTSAVYTDDSGVKAGGSRLLVVGGIKIRGHGRLLRAVRHVRDTTGFMGEFKFSEITRGALPAYFALVDELAASDARIIATVTHRPKGGDWRFYAATTVRLLGGNINRNEIVTVFMDNVSTPRGIAFEDHVQRNVNKRLGEPRVTVAACLNSKSSDGLQIADLVAGAVAFERRLMLGESGRSNSNKAKVVNRLKAVLGVADLGDARSDRVNIQTWAQVPRGQNQVQRRPAMLAAAGQG